MGDLVEWNLKLRVPLEVIQEEEEQSMTGVNDLTWFVMIERLPSFSMFNPESDSELDREFPVMSENDPTRFVRIERLPSLSIKPEFYLGFGSELDNYFPVMDVKNPIRFRGIEIFPSLSII